MATTTINQLRHSLRPFRRRLHLADGLRWTSKTAWLGALGYGAIQALARAFPIPDWQLWALIPPLLWLITLLFMLLRPLSVLTVAKRTEQALDLRERFSTALEL